MTQKIVIEDCEWEKKENLTKYCRELEMGNILFFPHTPFAFPQDEIDFLLRQKQGNSKGRKNIAYKPQLDCVTNHDTDNVQEKQFMHTVLKNYSTRVADFLKVLLSPYAAKWKLDYASFRPFQEKGRDLRLRARNDLLHVDSFPTRPMHGSRILRFFTNINPVEPRRWMTSLPFEDLLQSYGGKGVAFPRSTDGSFINRLLFSMKKGLHKAGALPSVRSPYDHFMMNMHNFLKENSDFQKNCPKQYWDFPPNCCWAVFTDQVSHAALSGQYALEQTLFIPRQALLFPEKSPVSLLERLTQKTMTCTSV